MRARIGRAHAHLQIGYACLYVHVDVVLHAPHAALHCVGLALALLLQGPPARVGTTTVGPWLGIGVLSAGCTMRACSPVVSRLCRFCSCHRHDVARPGAEIRGGAE